MPILAPPRPGFVTGVLALLVVGLSVVQAARPRRLPRPGATARPRPSAVPSASVVAPPAPERARRTSEPVACPETHHHDIPRPAPAESRLKTSGDWARLPDNRGWFLGTPVPRFGSPSGLTALAPSTLVYERWGHLWRTELPAGQPTPLSEGDTTDRNPRWSSDGEWLFFLSNRVDFARFGTAAPYRVFRMRADGTGVEPSSEPFCLDHRSDWAVSGDGGQVAYAASTFQGTMGPSTLHLVDTRTGRDESVLEEDSIQEFSFSRDGRELFFVRGSVAGAYYPDDESTIAVMALELATRRVRRLPNPRFGAIHDPIDLGDGRILQVASETFSFCCSEYSLYTTPRAGGAWEPLGNLAIRDGWLSAVPSPDGRQFLALFRSQMVLLDAAGKPRGRSLLAPFPSAAFGVESPSWAPDSRHVALQLSFVINPGFEPPIFADEFTVVVRDTQNPGRWVRVDEGRTPVFRPRAP